MPVAYPAPLRLSQWICRRRPVTAMEYSPPAAWWAGRSRPASGGLRPDAHQPVIGELAQLDRCDAGSGAGVTAPDPAVQRPGVGGMQGYALRGQQLTELRPR